MSEKTYLITEIIPGKNQKFLKSVNDSGADWIENIDEALKFTVLKDAETKMKCLIDSLMTNHKDISKVKIIQL